jgi:sulfoxide reductase heme-binding subunit YedZ
MDADTALRRIAKPAVFLACLLPAAWLALGVAQLAAGEAGGRAALALGANPVEKVQDTLGIWGLRLLLATLAVTPLRVLTHSPKLHHFRRMLGLFAFAYVAMHFLWYLFVDQAFDWEQLAADVVKRPYITAGFTALLLLLPLALTSTRRAMRRLGRRWERLHRLVYPAAILACVHYWWQVKADIREPAIYAGVLALLLGWRLFERRQRRLRSSAARARGERREADAAEDQRAAKARPRVHGLAEQPPAQH